MNGLCSIRIVARLKPPLDSENGAFGSGSEPAESAMSFTGDKAKKTDDTTK